MRPSLFAIPFLLVACGGHTAPDASSDVDVARSALPRDTSPSVSTTDSDALAQGNLAFAQGLYGQLAKGKDENVFFSPISVTYALSMTYAGARGDTAKEMREALHFTLPDASVHAALDALDLTLASRGKGAMGKDGEAFRLRVVNSVWGEKTTSFEAPFLDTLATDYGAGINLVDFVGAPDPSRVKINGWVEKETEGRIKDLLGPGTVDASTKMVLVNAVYFNGAWMNPFTDGATANATFHAKSGDVSVPTMHTAEKFPYAKGADYEAIALPYQDPSLELLVVMPTDLASFEGGLDAAKLSSIGDALASKEIELAFPKFKIAGEAISLTKVLEALGIHRAFSFAEADFTGIQKAGGLAISDVLHKAFVEVDEKGTEAAAATAVVVGDLSISDPPIKVSVDRPFAIFLRDKPTKTILFAGHVTNPAS
ncbi:MAG: serpin family protein [Polyangiales bacterium]